jgi:hypothetical protein
VKRDLKRRHRPGDPGTSLDADIRCDPLGDRIVEISVEQGSAHGWSLALWRLVRRGESFAATRIGFHGRYNAGDPQTYAAAERFDVALERGEVDAARVDSSLYRVRASLLATAREVGGAAPVGSAAAVPTAPVASSSASARPPSVGNSGVGAPTASSSGRSSWATSESFVTGVRLVDAEGRVLERWFAGNEEAEAQPAYLPIQLAEAALAPALEAVTRGEGEPGPTDRRFFVDRFRAARARFLDPRFPPWTRQAYVALASQLGTSELVPALIELGVADRDERTRYHAVNALVTLTGWDPRSDDASRPRPASDVAADFARECRP